MAPVLLIDGDALVSACGFSNEVRSYVVEVATCAHADLRYLKEARAMATSLGLDDNSIFKKREAGPLANAVHGFSLAMNSLLEVFPSATEYELYIGNGTAGRNFRYDIYPEYKANRLVEDKPLQYAEIVEYAVHNYGAQLVSFVEVDDVLSIRANKLSARGREFVVVGVDKDLLQIEGLHYRLHKKELVEVDQVSALRSFYTQVLTGDTSDNVPGLRGVGDVTAKRIIEACEPTAKALYDRCLAEYLVRGKTESDMELSCELLYLLRSDEDGWKRPD